MKSIQSVSIWKILGSFLVLTLCLSEAQSGDGIVHEELALGGGGRVVLEEVPSGEQVQQENAEGGSSLRQRNVGSGQAASALGEQDVNAGLPLPLQRQNSSGPVQILKYWVPLFSVPFAGDVKNFILACLGDLPPCPDCFSLSQRLGLIRDAVPTF